MRWDTAAEEAQPLMPHDDGKDHRRLASAPLSIWQRMISSSLSCKTSGLIMHERDLLHGRCAF